MKREEKCSNCDGYKYVSTDIPCPHCTGNGVNELVALQNLANWVYKNYHGKKKIPKEVLKLLNLVRLSQNKSRLYENS